MGKWRQKEWTEYNHMHIWKLLLSSYKPSPSPQLATWRDIKCYPDKKRLLQPVELHGPSTCVLLSQETEQEREQRIECRSAELEGQENHRPTSSSWRCDACDRYDPKLTSPLKGKVEFTKLMHSALAVQPVKPAAPKIHDISPETTCMFIRGNRPGWAYICVTSLLRQEM